MPVFTKRTIETLFGQNALSRFLTETMRLPEKQEAKMRRLRAHLSQCSHAIATRREDMQLASEIIGGSHVSLCARPLTVSCSAPTGATALN